MCGEWAKVVELANSLNTDYPLLLTKIKVDNRYEQQYLFAGRIGGEKESVFYIQCPNPYAGSGAMYTVWGDETMRAEARRLSFAEDMYIEKSISGKYFEVQSP